jgi:hypothetical protein
MYKVIGGVYTNTEFSELEQGTQECYGPFNTYEEAYSAWNGATWAKVDNCCHRLQIMEI